MPGTVKSELLSDADRSHKYDSQEKVCWIRHLSLDKSHFITGETVIEAETDNLKAISEKLEVINLQLAQRKTAGRKIVRWLLISLCVIIVMVFAALAILNSPYLAWDYSDPETAVLGVAFHSLEWLFVRVAPIIFIAAIIGIFFTFKRK